MEDKVVVNNFWLKTIGTILIMGLGPVIGGAIGYGALAQQVDTLTKAVENHEEVINSVDVMQVEIRHIKDVVEEIREAQRSGR